MFLKDLDLIGAKILTCEIVLVWRGSILIMHI